tara:strand:- start:513 stop:1145 length:633 start_codon:yes stop_codon:yes gene_type:complete
MYKNHAVKCQAYAQRNADNFADVVMMVSLSIQQNWLGVGDQLQDVRLNKENSKFLWGMKATAYKYIMTHKHKIYAMMKAVMCSNHNDEDKAKSLMKVFLRIEGLGLVKAGFVCQLTCGLVGCMDVHNIKAYKIDEKMLTYNKKLKTEKGIKANEKKIENYIKMCHDYGTEELWNAWCESLALKSDKWVDGFHVSEVHYTYLTNHNRRAVC